MNCSECGTNLPADSSVCPKCGKPRSSATEIATLEADTSGIVLFCPKCGASLPDDSGCLKCKRESATGANAAPVATVPQLAGAASATRQRAGRRYQGVMLFLLVLAVLLGAIWWFATNTSPEVREFRETISGFSAEDIVDSTFVIKPQLFSSYKFSVPAPATGVVVNGQFNDVGAADQQVEVLVLSESAFATWQHGYATSTYYESGKVNLGNVEAPLPSGPGVYYVVFSNKSSLKTPRTVRATIILRYNKWIPDWILHLRETFWTPRSE